MSIFINAFTRFANDIQLYYKPLIITVAVLMLLKMIFGEVCPMKIILGLPCPACGLTHSVIYILALHFKDAFNSNPTGFIWFIAITAWLGYRYFWGKSSVYISALFVISGLSSIAVYILKMIN